MVFWLMMKNLKSLSWIQIPFYHVKIGQGINYYFHFSLSTIMKKSAVILIYIIKSNRYCNFV
jgi:hypothetical protein